MIAPTAYSLSITVGIVVMYMRLRDAEARIRRLLIEADTTPITAARRKRKPNK